jgi:tetratricopeptide (TPR) repeat protein
MKPILSLLILLQFTFFANGQKVFDFNATCAQSFQDILQLKIKSGKTLALKAKQSNQENLIPIFLESHADFYLLFLNESSTDYDLLFPIFQERLNILEEGPHSSPFYLFSLATLRLQRALVSVKFGNTWDAAWDFRKAYLLLKENKKKFPNFSPNELMYGSLEALIGTVPKGYKWLANILGMKGSITDGMRRVNQFCNSSDPWAKLFFNQAAFIYPYLLFLIDNKKEEALQFIQQKKLDLVNNHLHAFMAANLALSNKQNELSRSIILNRNKSEEYLTMSVWDYQLGFIKLYHLEYKEARNHFELYTQNFKGNFYIKDVFQKISWVYYLQGNLKSAEEARKQVLKKGSAQSDADKQALKDAKNNYWPNPLLLKARLLNDGGYHMEAYKLLAGKSEDDFEKIDDKLEFAYRAARIYDDLGKSDEAIKNYLIAIKIGQNKRAYFAARAALQIAQIYEQRGQIKLAITYYQKCLDMEDHEYKDSIDQKAKAGISRCKGE